MGRKPKNNDLPIPEYGKRLKRAIEYAGLTQAQIQEACGISPGTVSRIINGHRQPEAGTMSTLAEVCGVREEYLRMIDGYMTEAEYSEAVKKTIEKDSEHRNKLYDVFLSCLQDYGITYKTENESDPKKAAVVFYYNGKAVKRFSMLLEYQYIISQLENIITAFALSAVGLPFLSLQSDYDALAEWINKS